MITKDMRLLGFILTLPIAEDVFSERVEIEIEYIPVDINLYIITDGGAIQHTLLVAMVSAFWQLTRGAAPLGMSCYGVGHGLLKSKDLKERRHPSQKRLAPLTAPQIQRTCSTEGCVETHTFTKVRLLML